MPTYSVKLIRKPRVKPWLCSGCETWNNEGMKVRLFGCAHTGDTPYALAICLECAQRTKDKKVRAELYLYGVHPVEP